MRNCIECGREFEPRRRDMAYCGKACIQSAYARRRRGREGFRVRIKRRGGGYREVRFMYLILEGFDGLPTVEVDDGRKSLFRRITSVHPKDILDIFNRYVSPSQLLQPFKIVI